MLRKGIQVGVPQNHTSKLAIYLSSHLARASVLKFAKFEEANKFELSLSMT